MLRRTSTLLNKVPTSPQASFFPIKRNAMLPSDTYAGKTCLVTGGGTGLGKAMATRFAELGADVVIASRKMDVLEKTAEEINELVGTGRVSCIQMDQKSTDSIVGMYDQCKKTPDVIVANAAGNFISPTERLSHNAFHNIIDIVLKGTVSVTLEAGKRLIAEKRPGVFLAITVPYAEYGSGYVVPSAAAKSGIEAMYKSLGFEWGSKGMRLNCIQPGPIYTEGAFDRLDPNGEFQKKMLYDLPLGRMGETEEISNLASFMCSDYASWWTGDIITFDGGQMRSLSGMMNHVREVPESEWDAMAAKIRSLKNKK